MADEAPLQRALEDPAQPLLLLEYRLQLRYLRAQRQSARPHTVRQTSSDQRGRSSIYPWHGVLFCARRRPDLELELEALLALLVPVHEEVHELHLAPARPRPS